MSEMDGMAAARRIRERDDKVVIVFITAAPQYAISGYEVRALSYLLKPLPVAGFDKHGIVAIAPHHVDRLLEFL